MQTIPNTPKPQQPSTAETQHPQHLNELTITPQDVYSGNGSTGQLTATGLRLREQNPCLTEVLIGQAQYDLHQRYPSLYPKVKSRPTEPDGLRRSSSTPATASSSSKPRLPDDQLSSLFGPGSNAGAANRLAKENQLLYRRSKARAIELGLLAPVRGRA